jgi:uncharacterized protein (DUF2237 family)
MALLKRTSSFGFILTLTTALLCLTQTNAVEYTNVYGNELQSCSSEGMALTGYTRTGYCVDQNDDTGSHHICIDMSSATGGDFCTVTGQSDWCSSEMACHEDSSSNCAVQDWCVCQWAFSAYIEKAGGCDQIQDVVCEAINMESIIAYQKVAWRSSAYQDALDCIVDKCSLDLSKSMYASSTYQSGSFFSNLSSRSYVGMSLLLVGTVALAVLAFVRRRKGVGNKAQLLTKEGTYYGSHA